MHYKFSLVFFSSEYDDPADLRYRLVLSGLGDAKLSKRNGAWYLAFDRRSDTLESGVILAIKQLEGASDGIIVRRIEPSDLVTSAEIARRLNRSRQSIQQLIAGDRGPGGFPLPIGGVTTKTLIWSWVEVLGWMLEHEKYMDISDFETAKRIKALNDAIEIRGDLPRFEKIKRLAELLAR